MNEELKRYREEIDMTDEQLLSLLSRRLDIVDKIGRVKRKNGLPLEDAERERLSLDRKCKTEAQRQLLSALMDIAKAHQRAQLNIYLIGMPYSGKSTMLRSISEKTDRACVDTDALIEQTTRMSIAEIFERKGEEYFRNTETEILRKCAEKGSSVISTGGGAALRDENIRIMKNSGVIVLCDRPLENLRESFLHDNTNVRPLVKSVEDLELLYFERFRPYRENADICINTESSGAADKILDFAREKELKV